MLKRFALVAAVVLAAPFSTRAHCDTLDGPVVKTARTALDTGKLAPVEKLLVSELREGLHHRFELVRARKAPADDVAAGRAWVAAYVPFVHYVEGVHQSVKGGAGEHREGGEHAGHAAQDHHGPGDVAQGEHRHE